MYLFRPAGFVFNSVTVSSKTIFASQLIARERSPNEIRVKSRRRVCSYITGWLHYFSSPPVSDRTSHPHLLSCGPLHRKGEQTVLRYTESFELHSKWESDSEIIRKNQKHFRRVFLKNRYPESGENTLPSHYLPSSLVLHTLGPISKCVLGSFFRMWPLP